MLDLLIPRFPLRQLPAMLAIAAVGTIAASLYGIVHDELTYTLSPEYFTRLKFQQFAWADIGWPRRVFVGQIGLLASWWVGLIGGWLVARAGAAQLPYAIRLDRCRPCVCDCGHRHANRRIARLDLRRTGRKELQPFGVAHRRESFGVHDLPSFVVVAYIHSATYLGAAIGVVLAILYVHRARTNPKH